MSTIHVSTGGDDRAAGTPEAPLRTINEAARRALPGDTVEVHEGVYREWVKPVRGGLSDARRITFTAAEGEHVRITGSERVTGWVREDGNVWRVELPNAIFGSWNPFALEVAGDWVVRPEAEGERCHLGEVYLNGDGFHEVFSRDALANPERRERVVDDRTGREVDVHAPERTVYVWYAEVGDETTTLWANFQGADPNAELVEVNVRRSVFYPEAHHLDWITVRGFELCQAATPWAPPTADQPGLVGPNWAKGWIIEDNHIHDAKCSAVSLGKEASTGDNDYFHRGDKPGYQYQLEAVFKARHIGWSKEHIGSHVVRRNRIHACGQNGIVGHLGCVFSRIEDNEIYDVAVKREFYGHEIGGIKLHAAIDVTIEHNHIHHTALGIWSDWQTQGTRFTRNVLHHNARDLYVEVSHGPYVVDNNVLASPAAIESMSDGGAYLHNLVLGTTQLTPVRDRATPYHVPHSTEVAGYGVIQGADDRFIGNIFVGAEGSGMPADEVYTFDSNVCHGTSCYDGHPASMEDFLAAVRAAQPGDHNIFLTMPNPMYVRDNAYLAGAQPYEGERGAVVVQGPVEWQLTCDDGRATLVLDLPAEVVEARVGTVTTADLPRVRLVDAEFDDHDGSSLAIEPTIALVAGRNEILLW